MFVRTWVYVSENKLRQGKKSIRIYKFLNDIDVDIELFECAFHPLTLNFLANCISFERLECNKCIKRTT